MKNGRHTYTCGTYVGIMLIVRAAESTRTRKRYTVVSC